MTLTDVVIFFGLWYFIGFWGAVFTVTILFAVWFCISLKGNK